MYAYACVCAYAHARRLVAPLPAVVNIPRLVQLLPGERHQHTSLGGKKKEILLHGCNILVIHTRNDIEM